MLDDLKLYVCSLEHTFGYFRMAWMDAGRVATNLKTSEKHENDNNEEYQT